MKRKWMLWLLACSGITLSAQTETDRQVFTLDHAIALAQEQSPEAQAARHTYRSAYWSYRSFRANYLPSVSLISNPYLNRQINKVTQPDGTELFIRQNQLSTDLGLQISQNLSLTGGNFFVQTSSQRMDELGTGATAYSTQPISIGYSQSLFGYNYLKWDKRIEPVRFREAGKAYAETLELIASKTCELFYSLATAQTNLNIAAANYASADTLYRYARGRYNIGNITENEMLQLEVNKLNEETNLMQARIEVEDAMLTFRSFLGIREDVTIEVAPSDSLPSFEIPLYEALRQAYANSPDMDMYQRLRGLSQTSDKFKESYRDPLDQQYVSLSIAIPILDWGRGKGKVRVAKSQVELVETQVAQGMTDFELNVRKMVRQFNLQGRQVLVAAKTDRTAQKRYEVALRLYLLGKSTILDLNAATTEKDAARRNYMTAMQTYWTLYYGLRSMTQYDFEHDRPLWHNLPTEL